MRRIMILMSITALLVLTGCVPSLQPLYTDEDLSFDPALLGTWTGGNPGETWEFKHGETRECKQAIKTECKEYRLVVTEPESRFSEGGKGEFTVHLVMVDGMRFLDLFPAEPGCPLNSLLLAHLVPAHTFWRVSQIEPSLKLAYFSFGDSEMKGEGWLQSFLKMNPTAIRHEQVEDGVLLTAAPKELQHFLLAHLQEGFGEPMELQRQQPEDEPEEE
jgi:hypothetical protein